MLTPSLRRRFRQFAAAALMALGSLPTLAEDREADSSKTATQTKPAETVERVISDSVRLLADDGSPFPDLRAAAERTLGVAPTGQGAERLVGSDNRKRITTTSSYPWSALCYLEITAGNGQKLRASGVLIGPKTVLTNGISVYDKNTGGWARSIKVYPGRNDSSSPFGSATSTKLTTFKAWTNNRDSNYNVGGILLDKAIGNSAGWHGIKSASDSYLTDSKKVYYAYGYPTGKSPDRTLWGMSGSITGLLNSGRMLKTNIDITGGEWGCPLFHDDRDDGLWLTDPGWMPAVVGVMGSESSSSDPAYNMAVRITSEILTTVKGWIQ